MKKLYGWASTLLVTAMLVLAGPAIAGMQLGVDTLTADHSYDAPMMVDPGIEVPAATDDHTPPSDTAVLDERLSGSSLGKTARWYLKETVNAYDEPRLEPFGGAAASGHRMSPVPTV